MLAHSVSHIELADLFHFTGEPVLLVSFTFQRSALDSFAPHNFTSPFPFIALSL